MTEAAMSVDPSAVLVEHPSADAVVIERWYPAPQALMWRLWTDPAHVVRWFGPEGVSCPNCDVDLRVGGKWAVTMMDPECDSHRAECEYLELDPPRRLVCTWAWVSEDGPGATSRLAIELTPEGDGCRLRLSHTELPEEYASKHEGGWLGSLECLSQYIVQLDAL